MASYYISIDVAMPVDVKDRLTSSFHVMMFTCMTYARLGCFINAFAFMDPTVCNSLPDYIKACSTIDTFKCHLKDLNEILMFIYFLFSFFHSLIFFF